MKARSLFLLILTGLATQAAPAAAGQEGFSADMILTSAREGQMTAKLYSAEGKSRMEFAGNVVINRMDRKVAWVLMPSESMYMEQPLDVNAALQTTSNSSDEVERVAMGRETVDGRSAEKFKVTYSVDGRRESVYQWMADGITVPVKIQALNGEWAVEYRNIQSGGVSDSVFEVPAGYQKFDMGGMAAQFLS